MKKTFIYGLYSTSSDEIRYIGKSDNPDKRLMSHIYNTKLHIRQNKKLTHKEHWLIKNDFNVKCVILEECNYGVWPEREQFYIEKYDNLTNTAKGGVGGGTIIYTKTYDEIKNWVQSNLNVKSKSQWYDYTKKNNLPEFIPANPKTSYKNRGWVSWGDFLGTGRVCDNYLERLSYSEAKRILKPLKLKSATEYWEMYDKGKIPDNIPKKAHRYYKNRGWVSWGDFLSNGFVANQLREFYSYDEFKAKVSELGFKTYTSYKQYIKNNKSDMKLPTNPNNVYKDKGWVGWSNMFN